MALTNRYLMEDDGGAVNANPSAGAIAATAGVAGVNKTELQKVADQKNGTGGGGKGGTTTGGVVSGGYDANAAYLSMLEAQLAAQRAAAQEAYNRNMARIASAYDSARGSIRGNYDSTVDRLNFARDKSMGEVNSDAEKSLREAYINNMQSKKNLNQRLSAMGYNGGATETSMAQLANNYGSSRTDINEVLNRNIADLEQTYGDNLASALQSYNSAMSNLDMQRMQLEMQAENALNSASSSSMNGIGSLLSMDQSYLNALSNALANQGNYTYDPTKATNDFVAGQAIQAQSAESANNYAKYLAQSQLDASNGANKNAILTNLYRQVQNGNLDITTLAQLRQQLGI